MALKTIQGALLCALTLLAFAVPLQGQGPFREYQEIVIVEPYGPGGGGGAQCYLETTIRIYSDGTESYTVRTVC